MTATVPLAAMLRRAMPDLRGDLVGGAALAPLTWFRTGGEAEVLFEPADEADLAHFLAGCPADVPITVVGAGSNLLVRDGGIDGVTLRLGRGFTRCTVHGETVLAGAAVPDVKLAAAAANAGLAGLSFLRGVPGSVGGALRMNAGAYGREIADVLVEARGIDRSGAVLTFDATAMGFTYRHCGVPDGIVFVEATLRGERGDPDAIRAEMAAITAARAATQPIKARTGGSTFKNPDCAKAWQLVDAAGCRGLSLGDAQVSDLHTNFLINRGTATAADIEGLGELVRDRVRQTSGVELEWEIARIGRPR